jgi:hypothetical protein
MIHLVSFALGILVLFIRNCNIQLFRKLVNRGVQEVLDISRNHANYFLREAVGATQIQAWKNPPPL